jgi:hypothetical protein
MLRPPADERVFDFGKVIEIVQVKNSTA